MTTEQKALRGSRLDAKYDQLIQEFPDDWFVVVDDDIVHGSTPEEVRSRLIAAGRLPGEHLITRFPGRPPYIVL